MMVSSRPVGCIASLYLKRKEGRKKTGKRRKCVNAI
jgi:hypothetical protein